MWTSQNSLENSGSSEIAVLWMTVAGIVVAACLAGASRNAQCCGATGAARADADAVAARTRRVAVGAAARSAAVLPAGGK